MKLEQACLDENISHSRGNSYVHDTLHFKNMLWFTSLNLHGSSESSNKANDEKLDDERIKA